MPLFIIFKIPRSMVIMYVEIFGTDNNRLGEFIHADLAYNPTRKDNSHVVEEAGSVLGYVYDYINRQEVGFITQWGLVFDSECNHLASVSESEMGGTRLTDMRGNHIGGIRYAGMYREINDENSNKIGVIKVTEEGQNREQNNVVVAGTATLFLLKIKK